jgi:hypothetical protein
MSKHVQAADADIFDMPIDDLKARVAEGLQLVQRLMALFPGAITMTTDERTHSDGHFQTGEAQALVSVLDLAAQRPELFTSLADKDQGKDPKRFETELVKDRLMRGEVLGPLADAIAPVSHAVADSRLHCGELSKPVSLKAYGIASAHAVEDAGIRTAIQPALQHYAHIGRASARAREAKRKAKPPTGGA